MNALTDKPESLSKFKTWKLSLLPDAELQSALQRSLSPVERNWITSELSQRKASQAQNQGVESDLPSAAVLDLPLVQEPWHPKFAIKFAEAALVYSGIFAVISMFVGVPQMLLSGLVVGSWALFVKWSLERHYKEGAVLLVLGSVCMCFGGYLLLNMLGDAPHLARAARGLMWLGLIAAWSVLASLSVLPALFQKGRLQ